MGPTEYGPAGSDAASDMTCYQSVAVLCRLLSCRSGLRPDPADRSINRYPHSHGDRPRHRQAPTYGTRCCSFATVGRIHGSGPGEPRPRELGAPAGGLSDRRGLSRATCTSPSGYCRTETLSHSDQEWSLEGRRGVDRQLAEADHDVASQLRRTLLRNPLGMWVQLLNDGDRGCEDRQDPQASSFWGGTELYVSMDMLGDGEIDFGPRSSLMVLRNACKDGRSECGAYYFNWQNNQFTLVKRKSLWT